MKKSINIWSFVGKTNKEAMKLAKDAGFEGIELALGGEGEITMTSTDEELLSIKAYAEELGIKIPSLSSGLCWANSLTANDPEERQRAFDMVVRQLYCAKMIGAETILVIPGSVSVEFVPEWGVVDYDVVWDRALEQVKKLPGGTAVITLTNGRKRAVPQITTTAPMTIEYNGGSWTNSAGTYTIPELELTHGENTVTVTGSGTITFEWQEGEM